MMKALRKLFAGILAIALIPTAVVLLLACSSNHIADTNGPDNFALEKITDENICKLDTGSIGVGVHRDSITNTETYSSNRFTGVYEVFYESLITNRFEITVNHARVDSGNFKMVLCVNDEIVHTFALNELTQTFVLENVAGTVSLRIAGESADFMFDYHVL